MNRSINMPVYLWDTNILIYYFNGDMNNIIKKDVTIFMQKSFQISVISKMEFLGFPFSDKNKKNAIEFMSYASIKPLNDEIVKRVIEIRQLKRIKLPDAIIAATAMELSATLITRNIKYFKQLDVDVFNPFVVA